MSEPDSVKQCCARAYESDFARLLLGESFHPGGVRLTERLGVLLGLTPESRVLDVASGNGASAFYIAERFGCRVVGIDYSARNVEAANAAAVAKGLADKVRFSRATRDGFPSRTLCSTPSSVNARSAPFRIRSRPHASSPACFVPAEASE